MTYYSVLFLIPSFFLLQHLKGALSQFHDPNTVKFYLYNNPKNYSLEAGIEMDVSNISTILSADLKENIPTKIIIHGFTRNYRCWVPQKVKDTYFERGVEANIIAVDWQKLAEPIHDPTLTVSYLYAVQNVNITGVRVADLILLLSTHRNVPLENIHLIGFSLGAHVSGEAGYSIQRRTGGKKVGRISGLDPAAPLFLSNEIGRHLRKSDAEFVDVYHTSIGAEGIPGRLGTVDFLVNGGHAPQPHCNFTKTCSHDTAPNVFIQSIGRHDLCACSSSALAPKCNCGLNGGKGVLFGDSAKHGTNGLYYMNLSAVPMKGNYKC